MKRAIFWQLCGSIIYWCHFPHIANFSQICSTQAGESGYDELSIGFEPIINKKYFEGIMQYKLHQCTQFLQMNNSYAYIEIQSLLNYFRSLQCMAIRDHSFFVWLRGSWWDLTSSSCSIWWPPLFLRNLLGSPSLSPKLIKMTPLLPPPPPPKKKKWRRRRKKKKELRERLKNFEKMKNE